MFKEMINRLVNGEDLTEGQMVEAMETIMGGEATHSQMAAFLTALRMKGETVAEIAGAARVMRERATPMTLGVEVVDIDREEINVERETMVDTCGTGGDSTNTFNISTATAFVLAGAGLTVAKHGNRSVSSLCGSADVLEALGVNLEVTTEVVQSCISKVGIGFMFAPLFHSAMKHVAPVRREMGIRTVFNILGPLANPAGAKRQVLGVYKRELVPVMAEVLGRLGAAAHWWYTAPTASTRSPSPGPPLWPSSTLVWLRSMKCLPNSLVSPSPPWKTSRAATPGRTPI